MEISCRTFTKIKNCRYVADELNRKQILQNLMKHISTEHQSWLNKQEHPYKEKLKQQIHEYIRDQMANKRVEYYK